MILGDREHLEREKLQLEIAELKRPWWRTPAYLAILLPTALALVTGLYAAMNGYFTELEERLKNEKILIEILEHELSMRKDTLQVQLNRLSVEAGLVKDSLQAQIDRTRSAADSMELFEKQLDSMQSTNLHVLEERNALATAIVHLQRSIDKMRAGVVDLTEPLAKPAPMATLDKVRIEKLHCTFKRALHDADEMRLAAWHPSDGERAQARWDRANEKLDSLLTAHPWLSSSSHTCP